MSCLKKFCLWFFTGLLICIVGISDVFADEIVNLGYITDHTNLVLINTSFGMTSNLPVNQVSTQDFTINQIDLYISYSFGANIVYLIELSTPNAILQNINDVSIVSGDTYCSFLGLDTSNANYPNIKFTCPNSGNLLSVSLSNSNGNSITSTNSFRWNYSYLRQLNSTIDIGPIINSQTQNTQDIINKLDEQDKTSKSILGKIGDILNYLNPFSENFFAYKLVELIINGLKSLFIPDNFDFLNNFKDTMSAKLGFIASIPLQLIDFIIDLKDYAFSTPTSLTFPTISILGYSFWNEMTIDITEGLSWVSAIKYVTDIICVILCVNTLRKFYNSFFGGGEN